MAVYEYKGYGTDGNSVKGVLTADTPEEARKVLRDRKVHVKSIKNAHRERILPSFKGGAGNELTTVSRQLATLLRTGTNLSDALKVILKQIEHKGLKSAFLEIHESLSRGVSFGNALEGFPRYFPNLYVSMVKAGESSGTLDTILTRISEYYQYRKMIMSEVVSAMFYPAIVVVFGTGVVIALITFIIPRITSMLMKSSAKLILPLPTRIIMWLSEFMRSWWWLLIIAGGFAVFGIYKLLKNPGGRYWFDKVILKVPVIGTLFEKSAISRFATTFSTLLQSGIPPLDALLIVQEVLNNKYFEKALRDVRQGVLDGNDMSAELERTGIFPPIVGHMISVGEETGELESLLQEIAVSYDIEIKLVAQRLISIIGPMMILMLAVVIGFIVVAVILPITQIGDIL